MTPDEMKEMIYEFLKTKIEELFILDRTLDLELNQYELFHLINDRLLTLDELTNEFKKLVKPYFDDYSNKMIHTTGV